MARRVHPQDNAGEPPPERRCTGTVTSHKANAGQPCQRWATNGTDTCVHHSPDRKPPPPPPPERRCQGFSKDANGKRTKPCKLWAIQGLTVCYRHGGGRKASRMAGERRMAEANVEKKARVLALRYDIVPVNNPLEALAQHAGEEIRFKDVLANLVAELEEIRYRGAAGEQIRAEITLYERALDRVGTRLAAYARLNIDERLAAIQEKQAERILLAIDAALAHAGITGPTAAEAKQVAARHLRSVA